MLTVLQVHSGVGVDEYVEENGVTSDGKKIQSPSNMVILCVTFIRTFLINQ